MPNVTGNTHAENCGNSYSGAFYNSGGSRGLINDSGASEIVWFDAKRCSGVYQSISEVRVKSIISNGFIRLY